MPDMEYICKGLVATLHELILAVFVIRPDPGRPTQISRGAALGLLESVALRLAESLI